MADADQRALVPFVSAPLATRHAHEPIIGPFFALDDPVRLSKNGQERGLHGCPIRKVSSRTGEHAGQIFALSHLPNIGHVRRPRVEIVLHVLTSQLVEGARLHPKILQGFVYFGESLRCIASAVASIGSTRSLRKTYFRFDPGRSLQKQSLATISTAVRRDKGQNVPRCGVAIVVRLRTLTFCGCSWLIIYRESRPLTDSCQLALSCAGGASSRTPSSWSASCGRSSPDIAHHAMPAID